MTKEKYLKLFAFFNKSPVLLHMICFAAKQLALIVAAVYALVLVILIINHDMRLLQCLIIPAFVFVFTTIFRKLINRQRPYDTLRYEPLVPCVHGKGQSFPSRHTASAWSIALVLCTIHGGLGVIMLIFALLISIGRICTGMHYPSDVFAGFLVALISFFTGFFVL